MDKVEEEKCWQECWRSSSLLDKQLQTESIPLNNNIASLCLQTAESKSIQQNDDDVYILWLINKDKTGVESLSDINISIFHSNNDPIDFVSKLQTSNKFLIIDCDLPENIFTCSSVLEPIF